MFNDTHKSSTSLIIKRGIKFLFLMRNHSKCQRCPYIETKGLAVACSNNFKDIASTAKVVPPWKMGRDGHLPLFETKGSKGRIPFGLYVVSTFVGICSICVYRLSHLPEEGEVGRWLWIGMFLSELWYILYWFVTLSVRWKPIYRYTFKDRLTQRSLSSLLLLSFSLANPDS